MVKNKSMVGKHSFEESIKRMSPEQRLKWKSKWIEKITESTRRMTEANMELCKELQKIR